MLEAWRLGKFHLIDDNQLRLGVDLGLAKDKAPGRLCAGAFVETRGNGALGVAIAPINYLGFRVSSILASSTLHMLFDGDAVRVSKVCSKRAQSGSASGGKIERTYDMQ